MSPARRELTRLVRLSIPVVVAQLGSMLLGAVDTVMVGRVGLEALAAASMANAWIFGLLLFGQGVVQGIDPLITQAHGAGRGDEVALTVQRGAVLSLLVSVPLAFGLLATAPALSALGQPESLIDAAHRYAVVQIPSIPCFLLFVTLRQYLFGREIVRPAMWVTLIANVVNVFGNYVLIFGKLGLPALGLFGAGIATSSTRLFLVAALAAWIVRFRLYEGAWTGIGRESFAPRPILRLLSIGVPVAIQMSLEAWAFSAMALIAGTLGAVPLASHAVVLSMAALAFMVPLGISQAAVTRVGNLIGARRGEQADLSARLAFALGGGVMAVLAVFLVALRDQLPRIYTTDAEVIALAAAVLPAVAAFQIFDGLQVVGCGVLRGMGQTRPAAVFNLIAYWLIGLPLGAWLAMRTDWGLMGIWGALGIGLGIVAFGVMIRVRLRGPSSAVALVT